MPFFPPPTQWQGETQEFCPGAKVVLVGCKMDMRTDPSVTRELAKHRLAPVTHEQVRSTNESISVSFSWSKQSLSGPVSIHLILTSQTNGAPAAEDTQSSSG